MFYYEIYYEDFKILFATKILKGKICFFQSVLSSRRENNGLVTRYHVKSSQMRNETPLQL